LFKGGFRGGRPRAGSLYDNSENFENSALLLYKKKINQNAMFLNLKKFKQKVFFFFLIKYFFFQFKSVFFKNIKIFSCLDYFFFSKIVNHGSRFFYEKFFIFYELNGKINYYHNLTAENRFYKNLNFLNLIFYFFYNNLNVLSASNSYLFSFKKDYSLNNIKNLSILSNKKQPNRDGFENNFLFNCTTDRKNRFNPSTVKTIKKNLNQPKVLFFNIDFKNKKREHLFRKMKNIFWLKLFLLKKNNFSFYFFNGNGFNRGIFKNFTKKMPYFVNSKIIFYDLNTIKNLLTKHETNLFNIQSYDYFGEQLIKLTKNSSNYDKFDIINIKNRKKFKNFFFVNKIKNVFFINNFLINDEFFESNYFFYNKKFSPTLGVTSRDRLSLNSLWVDVFKKTQFDAILSFKPENAFYFKSKFDKVEINSIKRITNNFNRKANHAAFSVFSFYNLFHAIPTNEIFFFLQSKPFLFKYLINSINFKFENNVSFFFKIFSDNLIYYLNKYFFYSKKNIYFSNVVPSPVFIYDFKKYVIRSFNFQKFQYSTIPWHHCALINFLEYCSGKKIYINFFNFLSNTLDYTEQLRCDLWAQRLKSFKRALGPKLFLTESLQIIYISLKLKDPYFLSDWLLNFFYKISFWKYKLVFRYLQYILRYFFWPVFSEIKLKGLKFQLKGKVSVAGNARTRTIVNKIGYLSHSTFDNKVLYNLNLIRTFTGVIGFKTWLTF